MFVRFLVFIIGMILGIAMIKYSEPLVRTFGKSELAEKYLGGPGGSYNMWKLLGIIVMIIGFLYLLGTFEFGQWDKIKLEPEKQEVGMLMNNQKI